MRYYLSISLLFICSHFYGQTKVELDSLKLLLEKISVEDQKFRLGFDSIIQKYGMNSPEFLDLAQKMGKQDSINMAIVGSVIDKYGWLSEEQTSRDANEALFLVIQHAQLETQLKYLPVMKKAVDEKKAKPSHYALLVDRTNMDQGKFQLYGSQFNYDAKGKIHLYPIFDEPRLNERRKSMGLPSMEEYCKMVSQFTNQKLTYVLPKTDLYKNKIVIKGSIKANESDTPLNNVSIYINKTSLTGKSDSSGFYQVVVDKKFINAKVMFKKQGYQPIEQPLEGKDRDVFELNPVLVKK